MRTLLRMLDRIGTTGAGLNAVLVAVFMGYAGAMRLLVGAVGGPDMMGDMALTTGIVMSGWVLAFGPIHGLAERLTSTREEGADVVRFVLTAGAFALVAALVWAVPASSGCRFAVSMMAWVVPLGCAPKAWFERLEALADRLRGRLVQAATAARSSVLRGP